VEVEEDGEKGKEERREKKIWRGKGRRRRRMNRLLEVQKFFVHPPDSNRTLTTVLPPVSPTAVKPSSMVMCMPGGQAGAKPFMPEVCVSKVCLTVSMASSSAVDP